ncbi:MAG: DUF2238 domain-containing protein [bacterium]|nr:DUF2238 domain-containing protein [bacterium]
MPRHPIPVILFTLLYMAIAAPVAWRSSNHEFVFYVGIMIVLAALIFVVDRRVGLHPLTLWALSFWGLLHMLGGLVVVSEEIGVLYGYWLVPGRLKFDQLVHGYGFAVSTWLCWQGIVHRDAERRPSAGNLFLAALAGMGLGALNEIVEFIATITIPETNVGGYVNTGWDLVANAVGATLAAVVIAVACRATSAR